VRKTGVMSADVGPCVIHCSAGIGRSGTFVMVDSILTEVSHSLMHLHLLAVLFSFPLK